MRTGAAPHIGIPGRLEPESDAGPREIEFPGDAACQISFVGLGDLVYKIAVDHHCRWVLSALVRVLELDLLLPHPRWGLASTARLRTEFSFAVPRFAMEDSYTRCTAGMILSTPDPNFADMNITGTDSRNGSPVSSSRRTRVFRWDSNPSHLLTTRTIPRPACRMSPASLAS